MGKNKKSFYLDYKYIDLNEISKNNVKYSHVSFLKIKKGETISDLNSSLILKRLGFNKKCKWAYDLSKNRDNIVIYDKNNENLIKAPNRKQVRQFIDDLTFIRIKQYVI